MVLPDKLLRILPEVRCPVAAIWGEFDRPHPDPQVQRAALLSVCPEAAFEVVPDAGHWAMYERPEAFEQALAKVLG
jgi:pimeloyl-ACP methyl ester carboxylesterase